MVRRIHIVAVTAVVELFALAGVVAFAQGPGADAPRGRGQGFGPGGPQAGLALGALGLTDAQREQVRQVVQQHRLQTRALVDRLTKAQEGRRQAVATMPPDEGRIRAAMQELGQAQAEVAIQEAQLRSDIVALLTPEQKEQAEKLRADREARMKQRQERMRRMPQRQPRPQA